MLASVHSMGLAGIEGYRVTVEAFSADGLPMFEIVGLPDAAVKESRERVRAAMASCALSFPVARLTVNLAPADVKGIRVAYKGDAGRSTSPRRTSKKRARPTTCPSRWPSWPPAACSMPRRWTAPPRWASSR